MNTNKKLLNLIVFYILIIIIFLYPSNRKLHDKNGSFKAKIIKEIYYNSNYELKYYVTYSYDNNLLKKRSFFNDQNNLYFYTTYDEFDANNNPIKYSDYFVSDNKNEISFIHFNEFKNNKVVKQFCYAQENIKKEN